MKQTRRREKEKNKEKYCHFWYGWQLVVGFKKFELWADVAALGEIHSRRRRRSIYFQIHFWMQSNAVLPRFSAAIVKLPIANT